jgi:hypothetical protein
MFATSSQGRQEEMLTRFMRGVPTVGRSAVRSPANALLAVQMRWANQQAQAQSHLFADDDKLRRRLLYRSKQRGAQAPREFRIRAMTCVMPRTR